MLITNKINSFKILDELYFHQIYGIKNLVSMYIASNNQELTKENCIVRDSYLSAKSKNIPYIVLDDDTQIRFMSGAQAAMEISIFKKTKDQITYSLIKYPPNMSKLLFVDNGLKYRPYMRSITISKDGIYSTLYKPYKKINGNIEYFNNTKLVTRFYNNDTLKMYDIQKNELTTLKEKLSKAEPDARFETEIAHLDENDVLGVKTLDYNIIQATIAAESITEKVKEKQKI